MTLASDRTAGGCEIDGAIVEAVAAAAAIDPETLYLHEARGHYKSEQLFLGVRDAPDNPRFVVKHHPGRDVGTLWNPQREYDGLVFAERHAGGEGFSTIHPVCFGEDPKFLATAYMPGQCIRPTIDRALGRRADESTRRRARELLARMAQWLAAFRSHDRVDEGVTHSESWREICLIRIGELRETVGEPALLDRLATTLDRLDEQMPAAETARLGRRWPTHGDFAPQNVFLDEAGAMYLLDFEEFELAPCDRDVAMLRWRFEMAALRGTHSRCQAQILWQAFFDAYERLDGPHRGFQLAGYLAATLSHMAWLSSPRSRHVINPRGLLSRWKEHRWIVQRLRWLDRLEDDLPAAGESLRDRL